MTLRFRRDASQFARSLYLFCILAPIFPVAPVLWSIVPFRREVILRAYAVEAWAFTQLYDARLGATMRMTAREVKERHGLSDHPFDYPGILQAFPEHHIETMILLRLGRAKKVFKRIERPVRWWLRRYG